jgi:hypothetical protein
MTANNTNFDLTMIATFKNLVSVSHRSLEDIKSSFSMPPAIFRKLYAADICNFQINKICNLLEYIFKSKDTQGTIEDFDPFDLLSDLTKTFAGTFAGYVDISTDCYSKLLRPVPMKIDKTKFEFLFLNLLYICLRSAENHNFRGAKFTLYITETQSSVVFHLRDNCQSINAQIIQTALIGDDEPISPFDDPVESIMALSFKAALYSAKELNGTLSYKALKSGNRYDISLPKPTYERTRWAKSPARYIPNYSLYEIIFSDLLCEFSAAQKEVCE